MDYLYETQKTDLSHLSEINYYTTGEFMELLSYVRLGLAAGLLQGVTPEELNALSVHAQPATLMAQNGQKLSENQRDAKRACLARQVCGKLRDVME